MRRTDSNGHPTCGNYSKSHSSKRLCSRVRKSYPTILPTNALTTILRADDFYRISGGHRSIREFPAGAGSAAGSQRSRRTGGFAAFDDTRPVVFLREHLQQHPEVR